MKYEPAPELANLAFDIIGKLGMYHVDAKRVAFVRSRGSKARRTLARIHGTPKIIQVATGTKAFYVVEVISEKFDRLSKDEQTKTIIHELMHIPANFGGGFRGHANYVNRDTVERAFREYRKSSE
ncbi:MAG: putative metallopeptidase [Candidatus Aenigmarchaeota archaeon]|nr:putative metallopeptidase [Candidatus Aenigmarchaeota archaeon]